MKNINNSSSSSSAAAAGGGGGGGGGGRKLFSSWTSPQNPLITLLKRKRESKTSAVNEKSYSGPNSKTSADGRQHDQHKHQQNAGHSREQTAVKITSSSSSTSSTPRRLNGTSTQKGFEYSLKRDTNGFEPRKIEEYEPGHSSIALKEKILEPAEYNPPICKPGELCRYSESKESNSFRIRKKTETTKNGTHLGFPKDVLKIVQSQSPPSDDSDTITEGTQLKQQQQNNNKRSVYKEVQAGGTIPEEGLWNLVEPRRVKTLPAPASGSVAVATMTKSSTGIPNGAVDLEKIFEEEANKRMGRTKTRQEMEEEMRTRRKTMDRIIAMEKLKRLEEERRMNEARRHNDNFLPIEKSPVKLNRYDDESGYGKGRTSSNAGEAKFTAVALYNFKAKNDRELGLKRGEVIRILKQVDKNWFEGEKNGKIGIFPITYVKIALPASQAKKEPSLKGRVLYDFNANSPPELSLNKGERVTILGSVDENWVEGRSRNGEGIFPLNYVKILDDDEVNDDDDEVSRTSSLFATPVQSRTATPSIDHRNVHSRLSLRERGSERFRVVSPVGSVASSYAPTVPSAPMSPFGSQDLDSTTGSVTAVGDWPHLEASLQDLERASIAQMMQQQQQQRLGFSDKPLERAVSLPQRYQTLQHRQQQRETQQREAQQRDFLLQQQKSLLRHHKQNNQQFQNAPSQSRELLSQSAHPDLCQGKTSGDGHLIRAVPRSATNSGLSERGRYGHGGQSSPSNRYPSFISKDSVVSDMMTRQSQALTKEFLSRHSSRTSVATETSTLERSVTPLARQSLPVSRAGSKLQATTLQRPSTTSGYVSGDSRGGTLVRRMPRAGEEEEEDEVFQFKEIKLKPRLPPDYSRHAYTVETRTSLPGGKCSIQSSSAATDGKEPPTRFGTKARDVSPMRSYEWHKVLYDYNPIKMDEITLKRGDLVQVMEKCRDGWWLGISQTTGKFGLFPGNYVIPT